MSAEYIWLVRRQDRKRPAGPHEVLRVTTGRGMMAEERELSQISDGKIYSAEDMAALGCRDCEGCSACCRDMEGLFLDPYDIFMMTRGTGRSFESLLERELTLGHHGGLFLPKMRMEDQRNSCFFLNEEGRCSIHAFRPGICRLFPLGRTYREGDFSYFLQTDECKVRKRYKVRIRKWLDIPDYARYHAYVRRWHGFATRVGGMLPELTEESVRSVILYVLKLFFELPYSGEDFYTAFDRRMQKAEEALSVLLD